MDIPFVTLPETNSKFAPENGWLEDEDLTFSDLTFFLGGRTVKLRGVSEVGGKDANNLRS